MRICDHCGERIWKPVGVNTADDSWQCPQCGHKVYSRYGVYHNQSRRFRDGVRAYDPEMQFTLDRR